MVTTMDMEDMRNGIGEIIIGQTIIIIVIIGIIQDIIQDVWDMTRGIDWGLEMEGKKISIRRETSEKNGLHRWKGDF